MSLAEGDAVADGSDGGMKSTMPAQNEPIMHTCINTASTLDGRPPPPCAACLGVRACPTCGGAIVPGFKCMDEPGADLSAAAKR